MASTAGNLGWLSGRVKAVPSGDSLVIVANLKEGIPPEKTITLSSLIAPKLARRGSIDEPFAWESREFLRKLCIGKDIAFRVDYTVPSIGREFGSVLLINGDTNVSFLVVAAGWAKVRDQGQQKGEVSPLLAELLRLEEQAKQQGLGRWNREPGASEASIRNLPPSAIGDSGNFDAMGLLASNKGSPMEVIVEQVRDGSTLRVYLLPSFQFVQVFVAGIQSPSMGRRVASEVVIETEISSDEPNGDSSTEPRAPLTTAQRLAASSAAANEVAPDPFGREAKHFTEIRVLNREVRIVLEGVDKFSNLIGSVYYSDCESAKDLALELVETGLAKYVEWSASLLEDDAKRRLKSAELLAKKNRFRMWTNYVPPATNSKAIHDQNFIGKVIEVASGDCIVVADDSLPFGDPSAERRVNLSSIRCPKMGNPRRDEKPAPYAREAKEFLRNRLIGRQVQVSMEYSRKVSMAEGPAAAAGATDSRVMDFGSVFLVNPAKDGDGTAPAAGSQQTGANIAELLVARGFANVIRHRDFEERSNYYDALLAAESRAIAGKKGMHSSKDPPVVHITDLLTASAKKARDFLPFLQRNRRMTAVVEYVLSGHRFKLYIPKETCSIAFSFSGVRCPGRDEQYSDEAIALMRRKIMQRDVEIEVETVDRTGTFLGTLWEARTNVAVTLLEAGLAKLQTSFGTDRIPDAHLLVQAEQSAKKKKLKVFQLFQCRIPAAAGDSIKLVSEHRSEAMARGYGLDSAGRLDIEIFYDGDPDWWLGKADEIFARNRLSEREKVEAATACWLGEAWDWFQKVDQQRTVLTWRELKGLMIDRFRPSQEGHQLEIQEDRKSEIIKAMTHMLEKFDSMIGKMQRQAVENGSVTASPKTVFNSENVPESDEIGAISKSHTLDRFEIVSAPLPTTSEGVLEEKRCPEPSPEVEKGSEHVVDGASVNGLNHETKKGEANLVGGLANRAEIHRNKQMGLVLELAQRMEDKLSITQTQLLAPGPFKGKPILTPTQANTTLHFQSRYSPSTSPNLFPKIGASSRIRPSINRKEQVSPLPSPSEEQRQIAKLPVQLKVGVRDESEQSWEGGLTQLEVVGRIQCRTEHKFNTNSRTHNSEILCMDATGYGVLMDTILVGENSPGHTFANEIMPKSDEVSVHMENRKLIMRKMGLAGEEKGQAASLPELDEITAIIVKHNRREEPARAGAQGCMLEKPNLEILATPLSANYEAVMKDNFIKGLNPVIRTEVRVIKPLGLGHVREVAQQFNPALGKMGLNKVMIYGPTTYYIPEDRQDILISSFSHKNPEQAGFPALPVQNSSSCRGFYHYVEGEDVSNGSSIERRQKEELKVVVTDVLGGGQFYVQPVADQKVASIQKQLASLNLQEAPVLGAFNPKKGDIVLAQFSADNSWNRAMIVNAPRGVVESSNDKFEVFYIDYGNQEAVTFSQLRPIDPSVSSAPGVAQLCSLAYLKVPTLEEDYGQEAAFRLSEHLLSCPKEFKAIIEERDTSGGKVKGQGTGTIFMVTLIDPEADASINATMLQDGLARLEKRRRWESKDRQLAMDELEKFQTEARDKRLGMWEYGDIESDDEESAPPLRKAAGKR